MLSNQTKLIILTTVVLIGWLIHLLTPVLVPLFVAAILAYLGDPLVDRLENKGLSRTLSVTVVFSGIFVGLSGIAIIVLPLLERQIVAFASRLPLYIDWIQESLLPWLFGHIGMEKDHLDLGSVRGLVAEHIGSATGMVQFLLASVSKSGLTLVGWAANLVLIPVVTFYILRDWDNIIEHLGSLIPRGNFQTVSNLANESDAVLGAFLRGQMMVMAALASIYTIGLWIIGVEFSLLIGVLAGLVSFVPYLGFLLGILIAGVMALVQFQELMPVVWVVAVFGFGQLLEGVLLTPLLVGDKTGLHPVVVIFSILIGGQLFGFVGVLLALPVAAVLMVIVRHIHASYMKSDLYGGGPGVGESDAD